MARVTQERTVITRLTAERRRRAHAAADRRSHQAHSHPVDLRVHLPAPARTRRLQAGDAVAARRRAAGREDPRPSRDVSHRHRHDSGSIRRPDGAALRPLRRRPSRRRVEVDLKTIRADDARWRDLRTWRIRFEGQCHGPRRCVEGLARQAAGRHQGDRRRDGGGRQRVEPVSAGRPRAVSLRRHADHRHGQSAAQARRR